MKTTTTLCKRCRSALLCVLTFFVFCATPRAQSFEDIPSRYLLGGVILILPDELRKAAYEKAKQWDTVQIRKNIIYIMLELEWVRTQLSNIDDSIPSEYCYLALSNHYLTSHATQNSVVTQQAYTRLWNLTDGNLKALHLDHELLNNEVADDASNLYLTTTKIANKFKEAHAHFRNYAVTMLIMDYGYEKTNERLIEFSKSGKQYKDQTTFTLDMNADVWIEYFALRYVLEPMILEQKTPTHFLTFEVEDALPNFPKAMERFPLPNTRETLFTYNHWFKPSKKIDKDLSQYWAVLKNRQLGSHSYPYPKLLKVEKKARRKEKNGENKHIDAPMVRDTARRVYKVFHAKTDDIKHTHLIASGETLLKIAKKYDVSVSELRILNNRNKDTDTKLQIGDMLIIRLRPEDKNEDRKKTVMLIKDTVLTNPNRGNGRVKSYENRNKRIHTQQRVNQSTAQEAQRGGELLRYPARLTPFESKKTKAYKDLKK